jgi:hypothetical protein
METEKQILDHQASPKTRQKLLARIVHLFMKTVLWILVSLVMCFVSIVLAIQIRASIFDEEMSEAKIVGKTPQAIIAQFGTPFYDSRMESGGVKDRISISYCDRWSHEICKIEFTKGMATKVEYFNKGN